MPDPPSVASTRTPAASDGAEGPRRHRRRPHTQDSGTRSLGQGSRTPVGEDSDSHKADGAGRPRRPRAQRTQEGPSGKPSSVRPDGLGPSSGPSGGRQQERRGGREPMAQDDPKAGDVGHRRRPRNPGQSGTPSNSTHFSGASTHAQTSSEKGPFGRTDDSSTPNRRRKFNSELTEGGAAVESATSGVSSTQKGRSTVPKADDLTSRLTEELSTAPYPDCLICFAPITPMQPTWSCSPSNPTVISIDDEKSDLGETRVADTGAQRCWMTFHLKCIRSWAKKSVDDVEAAWLARGEVRQGDWRCPGCQSKRRAIPSSYWCFCGSTPDPKPPRLATPHSCANPCSRTRECGHPCSLYCHPGPCPPCQVTTSTPCYCGKETMSFRCSNLGLGRRGVPTELSCAQTCGRKLSCGNHVCLDLCHPGKCSPCPVREKARCYCGKEEKELGCGEGEEKTCGIFRDGVVEEWDGKFACENTCERPFDCGIHHCKRSCHVPSTSPAPCPRSPSFVTHCPCGKHALQPDSAPFFPHGTLLTRTACTDPVPTCESTCMKPLNGCEHVCSAKCHTGPCPPCAIRLVRPCRCGSTTREILCSEDQANARARARDEAPPDSQILCDRPCGALRVCGRHQCNRICCPLASLAGLAKGRGKKRAGTEAVDLVGQGGWHECDLVCGKLLSCGNHYCEERDHRGACPPCLRSSFEEMVCHCGRTVLEPPIACGTRIACSYPCSRPPPECGHPKTQHACHEDPTRCPPCPYLASKQCACGKKVVDNVRCSQEKVSCGTTCGKLLPCGFHHCERLCHGDACGACHATCGKPRKFCLPAQHPCALPCHAPASCDESEPCRSIVTITCPCGRIRQSVPCGRSFTSPTGRESSQQLKCSAECAIAKRNARLAEALGINPERDSRAHQVAYTDDLLGFARANAKFCTVVEKSFSDFLSSDKKSQILPHMPEQKRNFVHNLAGVYRIDTLMVDQEPHRSVQLIRRLDSRVPTPLLSAAIGAGPTSSSSLGKLADLRTSGSGLQSLSRPTSSRASPAPVAQPTAGSSSGRGWTSVVAQTPSPAPSSWGPPERAKTPARPVPVRSPALAPPLVRVSPAPVPAATPLSPQDIPDDWEDAV